MEIANIEISVFDKSANSETTTVTVVTTVVTTTEGRSVESTVTQIATVTIATIIFFIGPVLLFQFRYYLFCVLYKMKIKELKRIASRFGALRLTVIAL